MDLRRRTLASALIALAALTTQALSADIVFDFPYQGSTAPPEATLDAPTSYRRVDAYLLVDNTSSMVDELAAMAANLTLVLDDLTCNVQGGACAGDDDCPPGTICFEGQCIDDPDATGCIAQFWTGVGSYNDCNTYANLQFIQADPTATAAAIPGVGAGGAEAPMQSVACVAGPAFCSNDPECGADPGVPFPLGCPGYRNDAFRILMHFTDADDQAGPACAFVTTEDAGMMLAANRIRYVGIIGDGDDGAQDPLTPFERARQLGIVSGSTDAFGEPFVYFAVDDAVPSAVSEALSNITHAMPVRISLEIVDGPGDGVDATQLIDYVETNVSGEGSCTGGLVTTDENGDGRPDTFIDVLPGTPVCWTIRPVAQNTTIPPATEEQSFEAIAVVRTDDAVVHERTIRFVVPAEGSGIAEPPHAAPAFGLDVRPNPSVSLATITFTLPESEGDWSLRIYDSQGRRVRSWFADRGVSGERVTWDARDDRGRRVAAGIYYVELRGGDRVATRKLTVTD